MADKILLRTGLEFDAGNLDSREPGFTSDTLRAVIGDGTNPKFLTSETVLSISTAAPAAFAQMEHTRTSIICDTDAAAASIALDITNGALVSPSVCYVHAVGTTVTRYVLVEYKSGYYRKIFVGSTCQFFWNGTEWFCPQATESMIGKIVGGGLRYVSSDSLRLRDIGYHINNGVQDFWVRIDAETTINSGTTNYPSAGNWAYVLGDKDGNITLAAATGAATERPSDTYFQWGELGGTGFNHYKKGYYSDATHRILGAIHKVSSTSFYLINSRNESDEVGENSNGSWLRIGKKQICWYDALSVTTSSLSNNNIGTYGLSYYYGTSAWTYPVPFSATTGLYTSANGPFIAVTVGNAPSVTQMTATATYHTNGASYNVRCEADGYWHS